jgi:hypothetical protein
MRPPLREGGERVQLEARTPEILVSRNTMVGPARPVFTQRVFLASPRGRYLAWADPVSGDLRVRDRRRPREQEIFFVSGRDARFSADERFVAALADSETHTNGTDLVLLELATGTKRVLAAGVDHPQWIEWVTGGVVVSHMDASETALTYHALAGGARRIATGAALRARFSASRRAHRVVYLVGKRVFVADVRRGEPREVGELPDEVVNMEMAPDGREAALVIPGAIHRVEGERLTFLVSGRADVHTIWYSGDSRRLAYASPRGVSVIDLGRRSYRLEAEAGAPVRSARFLPGGDLIVAAATHAFVWSPSRGTRRVVARAAAGETIDAADLYAGGAVTWRHLR